MNDVLENYGKSFSVKRKVVKFFEMDTNFS